MQNEIDNLKQVPTTRATDFIAPLRAGVVSLKEAEDIIRSHKEYYINNCKVKLFKDFKIPLSAENNEKAEIWADKEIAKEIENLQQAVGAQSGVQPVIRSVELLPLIKSKVISKEKGKELIGSKQNKDNWIKYYKEKLQKLGITDGIDKKAKSGAENEIKKEIESFLQQTDAIEKENKKNASSSSLQEIKQTQSVIRSAELLPLIKSEVISAEEGEKLIDSRREKWQENCTNRLDDLNLTENKEENAARWAEYEIAEEKKKLGIQELTVIKASDTKMLLEEGLLPGETEDAQKRFAEQLIDSKRDNWIKNCKEKLQKLGFKDRIEEIAERWADSELSEEKKKLNSEKGLNAAVNAADVKILVDSGIWEVSKAKEVINSRKKSRKEKLTKTFEELGIKLTEKELKELVDKEISEESEKFEDDIKTADLITLISADKISYEKAVELLENSIDRRKKENLKKLSHLRIKDIKKDAIEEMAEALARAEIQEEKEKLNGASGKLTKLIQPKRDLYGKLIELDKLLERYSLLGEKFILPDAKIPLEKILSNFYHQSSNQNFVEDIALSVSKDEKGHSIYKLDIPQENQEVGVWKAPIVRLRKGENLKEVNCQSRESSEICTLFHKCLADVSFVTIADGQGKWFEDLVRQWAEEKEIVFIENEKLEMMEESHDFSNASGINRSVDFYLHFLNNRIEIEKKWINIQASILESKKKDLVPANDINEQINTLRNNLEKEIDEWIKYWTEKIKENQDSYNKRIKTNIESKGACGDDNSKYPLLGIKEHARDYKGDGEPLDTWVINPDFENEQNTIIKAEFNESINIGKEGIENSWNIFEKFLKKRYINHLFTEENVDNQEQDLEAGYERNKKFFGELDKSLGRVVESKFVNIKTFYDFANEKTNEELEKAEGLCLFIKTICNIANEDDKEKYKTENGLHGYVNEDFVQNGESIKKSIKKIITEHEISVQNSESIKKSIKENIIKYIDSPQLIKDIDESINIIIDDYINSPQNSEGIEKCINKLIDDYIRNSESIEGRIKRIINVYIDSPQHIEDIKRSIDKLIDIMEQKNNENIKKFKTINEEVEVIYAYIKNKREKYIKILNAYSKDEHSYKDVAVLLGVLKEEGINNESITKYEEEISNLKKEQKNQLEKLSNRQQSLKQFYRKPGNPMYFKKGGISSIICVPNDSHKQEGNLQFSKQCEPHPQVKPAWLLFLSMLKDASSAPMRLFAPLLAVFAPLAILGLGNPLKRLIKTSGKTMDVPLDFSLLLFLGVVIILCGIFAVKRTWGVLKNKHDFKIKDQYFEWGILGLNGVLLLSCIPVLLTMSTDWFLIGVELISAIVFLIGILGYVIIITDKVSRRSKEIINTILRVVICISIGVSILQLCCFGMYEKALGFIPIPVWGIICVVSALMICWFWEFLYPQRKIDPFNRICTYYSAWVFVFILISAAFVCLMGSYQDHRRNSLVAELENEYDVQSKSYDAYVQKENERIKKENARAEKNYNDAKEKNPNDPNIVLKLQDLLEPFDRTNNLSSIVTNKIIKLWKNEQTAAKTEETKEKSSSKDSAKSNTVPNVSGDEKSDLILLVKEIGGNHYSPFAFMMEKYPVFKEQSSDNPEKPDFEQEDARPWPSLFVYGGLFIILIWFIGLSISEAEKKHRMNVKILKDQALQVLSKSVEEKLQLILPEWTKYAQSEKGIWINSMIHVVQRRLNDINRNAEYVYNIESLKLDKRKNEFNEKKKLLSELENQISDIDKTIKNIIKESYKELE